PLVSTDLAPSRGVIVTRASACVLRAAVESLPLPLPSPEPDPCSDPPPQAVTASITPSASAASFLPPRRAPTDAPDIGPPFTCFSPRRVWPDPAPQRACRAHGEW